MSDDALNLSSERLDPEACLAVEDPSRVSVPFPETQELSSLQECMSLVPPSLREEIRKDHGLEAKVSFAFGVPYPEMFDTCCARWRVTTSRSLHN
jgi:hypothetical protein